MCNDYAICEGEEKNCGLCFEWFNWFLECVKKVIVRENGCVVANAIALCLCCSESTASNIW